jgi:hypothetical protein
MDPNLSSAAGLLDVLSSFVHAKRLLKVRDRDGLLLNDSARNAQSTHNPHSLPVLRVVRVLRIVRGTDSIANAWRSSTLD